MQIFDYLNKEGLLHLIRKIMGRDVDLTQAEYDALPESKNSDGKNYYIYDSDITVTAEEVGFDGSASGSTATNSQQALDELFAADKKTNKSLENVNSNLPVYFGYSEYYTSTTSDFERINYQITIPANCIFSVGIQCYFSNSYPVGSCIANVDFNPYNKLAYNENIPFCSYTGYTRYEITLDFYGKWAGGASNLVSIGGFYKRM